MKKAFYYIKHNTASLILRVSITLSIFCLFIYVDMLEREQEEIRHYENYCDQHLFNCADADPFENYCQDFSSSILCKNRSNRNEEFYEE